MPVKLNISKGQRFGMLTVLHETTRHISKRMERRFVCKCDCGKETIVWLTALVHNKTKSCGCFQKIQASILCRSRSKHGHSRRGPRTSLYHRWSDIKKRCNTPTSWAYKYYGGRGITICPEWQDNFLAFAKWARQNGYKPELTIDRIDNNKGYSPENCRWITQAENSKKRHDDHDDRCKIVYNDKAYTLKELEGMYGIPAHNIYTRVYKYNWNIHDAITRPIRQNTHKGAIINENIH